MFGQVALNSGFQIAFGTTCIDVLAGGEWKSAQSAHCDGDRPGELDMKLVELVNGHKIIHKVSITVQPQRPLAPATQN